MKKIILIIIVLVCSIKSYSNDKTYMQFKCAFLNMPIENNLQFNYNQKTTNEKILLRSFVVSTGAFAGSYIINKYMIPNDQLEKKRIVNIIAASITVGVSINYLYKTSDHYSKNK